MRILKKKVQNDGLFKRLKMKKAYEKPSEYRRRKQREALRRQRIAASRNRYRRLKTIYNLRRYGIILGLDTISNILQGLGNPQDNFHAIHVAGTNGKGSIASAIATILHMAGYNVGLYTSTSLPLMRPSKASTTANANRLFLSFQLPWRSMISAKTTSIGPSLKPAWEVASTQPTLSNRHFP